MGLAIAGSLLLHGSETEKQAEGQGLLCCHQQSAALGNCLLQLPVKLALITPALNKA